jgi:hypothetical protein
MTVLVITLFAIFGLYLIDKHGVWRQALTVAIRLAVGALMLAGLLWGGYVGWEKYRNWQRDRQAAPQAAEQARKEADQKAKIDDCVANRMRETASVYVAAGTSIEDLKQSWVQACTANPTAPTLIPPKKHGMARYKGAVVYNNDKKPRQAIGTIPAGISVEILDEDKASGNVLVRMPTGGKVGWVKDSELLR